MSIRQMLKVWEHEFSHPHQAILLALADHAHEDGTGIRPSIGRIAWKTGYSARSVQNIMSQLRELGILVVAVPATHNTPNEYYFDWSVATLKPSFDEFMTQKKGRKRRGAVSAPLSKAQDRGAVPVQEGCNSDEIGVQFPCNRGAVAVQQGCSLAHPIRHEPSREPSEETKEPEEKSFQFGVVTYRQSPDQIDFADLWASNPGMAKMQLRAIAPGHKRPEMAAHGFGRWWVGPGLNDFDEFLIKACQNRKKKLEQPSGTGDAKTFINNMLKSGDWANFSLRCDEAAELRDRASAATAVKEFAAISSLPSSTEIPNQDQIQRREVVIGLAKYKASQGDLSGAKAIADLHNISYADIGLEDVPIQLMSA
ncbi:helix-turn-helix domain-containing protein [cf. Phormidesmis sp. LEGE 11477]|uniref:helix-turn-helix domain-containing protein n=1 Tax=cf. Phormidesmis sp. LEGE 11477 TaxID=1828680 RepID=UPI00188307DB|nr:helix-turn-helix domain-containing protein [cf. Phormidesmis sp. LEGE 11477]MBE9064270.1 hypothetical protein [cf. Phormidesmis sp. LEGE 11477]